MSAPTGMVGTPYEYPVARGKIHEFAIVAQSEAPEYFGPGAVIPPMFLTTASRWAPDGAWVRVGFEQSRMLHGDQEYVFYGPPPRRAGDTLYATEQLADRYEKAGRRGGTMRFAGVVTEFRDASGALVTESRATLIETAKPVTAPTEEFR
ncbi:FAS1-like dehydratase domain-containing protein [Parafrankia sp. FMc2]|uniref:FAS1-like dehydratase domain-containing protein n=1 Tax=Parafrankia sp. FMc2 TaxID=3233196 RepID=UPI0034D77BEC